MACGVFVLTGFGMGAAKTPITLHIGETSLTVPFSLESAKGLSSAIAGLLARKKYVPESSGTLPTDNGTFGLMVFAVIMIITALSFFPALTLGPLAEYFSLK